MPMFDFLCPECSHFFGKLCRDRQQKEFPCPKCGGVAFRQLTAPNFRFGDGKGKRGDTGVYSLDYSADLNVGRDAEQRWKQIQERTAQKRSVVHDTVKAQRIRVEKGQEARVALKRQTMENGEVVYEAMSNQEVKGNVELRSEFKDIYKEHKANREALGIPQIEDDKK